MFKLKTIIIVGILNSRQIKLASGLIKESGFTLKEFNNRNVLKLQNGNTTVYLHPKTNKQTT